MNSPRNGYSPPGTKIQGSAWFDNSRNNRFNPDPKAEVRFGDQTWDEMMVGAIGLGIDPSLFALQADSPYPAAARTADRPTVAPPD